MGFSKRLWEKWKIWFLIFRFFHMSVISTALIADMFEPSLEFGDGCPERRVAADAVIVAIDIIESHASGVLDRVEDLLIDLGLEP